MHPKDRKTWQPILDAFGDKMRGMMVEQTQEIVRALMELPRLENVGRAHAKNRGIEAHAIDVGATPTDPFIPRALGLAGREEIFILILHATQSLFLAKTRAIALTAGRGRIPIGSTETLQFLTIPWPDQVDIWLPGSGANTTGVLVEIARGGR